MSALERPSFQTDEWWVLVANQERDKAFAVIGPFHSEMRAQAEAIACGAAYTRVGSKL